jgi:hypothetical protein
MKVNDVGAATRDKATVTVLNPAIWVSTSRLGICTRGNVVRKGVYCGANN